MTVVVRGLSSTIAEFNHEIADISEHELRRASLNLLADLKRATPVDQGYARNSWNIGYSEQFINATRGGSGSSTLAPRDEPATIYITNGVPYINRLNEGSSAQAPRNFIESAILDNFDSFTGV